MFTRFHLGWLLPAFCIGCATYSVPIVEYAPEYTPPHVPVHVEEARPPAPPEKKKLKIALLPIVNATQEELPWDVAKEFQALSEHSIPANSPEFVFLTPSAIDELMPRAALNKMHFSTAQGKAQLSGKVDFIIALKLQQHDIKLFREDPSLPQYSADGEIAVCILKIKALLELIDVRDNHCKVIRQEEFVSDYRIPKGGSPVDYNRVRWDQKAFASSVWAEAHQRMLMDLAARVEALIGSL